MAPDWKVLAVCWYCARVVCVSVWDTVSNNTGTINIANPRPLICLLACNSTHRAWLQIRPGVMLLAHKMTQFFVSFPPPNIWDFLVIFSLFLLLFPLLLTYLTFHHSVLLSLLYIFRSFIFFLFVSSLLSLLITQPMQQNSSCEANRSSASQDSSHFLEPEGSLLQIQAPATLPYPEPDKSSSCLHIPLLNESL